MHICYGGDSKVTDEYGCMFRRLFPMEGVVDTLWGSGWANVKPGTNTTRHAHDEHEAFIVTSGIGEISVDGDTREVSAGDVIYVPPNCEHTIRNISTASELQVLCIWWGGAEADARMAEWVSQAAKPN